ncbi:MAG: hypothetical protein ACE5M4_05590 [Anaerolineales bacterium]
MADRSTAFRGLLRVVALLILILLSLSIMGHLLSDALAPSLGLTSSTEQSSGRSTGVVAHPLHLAFSWGSALGLAMLIGLTFKSAIDLNSDEYLSFPPPDRPPIVVS